MLPPLASVVALRDRLGRDLSGDDIPRAEAAIADASALVRAHARRDWNGENVPDAIVAVVLAVARRAFTNPDSVVTRTDGPFSTTYNRDTLGAFLTDAEKAVVERYRPAGSGRLWTQQTTRGEDCGSTLWLSDQYGTEPFPIGTLDDRGREVW